MRILTLKFPISSDERSSRICHLHNESWTLAPGEAKPGEHSFSSCGRTKDAFGKDIVVLVGSRVPAYAYKTYILDIEVYLLYGRGEKFMVATSFLHFRNSKL